MKPEALIAACALLLAGTAAAQSPDEPGRPAMPAQPAVDMSTGFDPDEIPEPNPIGRSGKLLLTGGVTSIEGAAGGGLTPWATIGSYGADRQIGANAFYTRVDVDDYGLAAYGAMLGFHDRVELSVARQRFDTRDVGSALGLGRGFTIGQDIVGLKVKLAGDAVLDQDRWLPQISIGAQRKSNNRGALLAAIGARDDDGTDYYLSATKLFLGPGLLLNATVRFTEANQFGLLGFGGDRHHGREAQFEASAAWLASRTIAIGAEYRSKPDNLSIAAEQDAWDVFIAWAPTRSASLTLAWVDLGNIVIADDQGGLYASLQIGF